jgi:uncharacterized membrane protein YhaH (DUF805 family)
MQNNDPYQAPGANVYDVAAEGVDETGPFSPSGRFGRLSYIAWSIAVYFLFNIATMVFGVGVAALQEQTIAGGMAILLLVLSLAVLVVYFLFTIRRLHDINASGWWSILLIVPFVGLILMILPGTEGANNYGPPRITRTWEKVVGIIGVVMMVIGLIGIVAAIAIPMLAA